MAVTVVVVTVKFADLDPAGIITVDGTETDCFALEMPIVVDEPAAWLSDTVQVLDALLPNVAGVQDSPVSCAGAVAVRPKICAPPLNEAVIWAV